MKEIRGFELADLLNKGFEGEIRFSGKVRALIRSGKDIREFYENEGDFSLFDNRESNEEKRDYVIQNSASSFYFSPQKGKKAKSAYERGIEHIVLPINLTEGALLEIEAKNIVY